MDTSPSVFGLLIELLDVPMWIMRPVSIGIAAAAGCALVYCWFWVWRDQGAGRRDAQSAAEVKGNGKHRGPIGPNIGVPGTP